MYAFQLTGPNAGQYREVARPKPREDELLIRVHRVGLCGTDVEMLRGTMPYFRLGWATYPVILGHEWSGTVVETGRAVDNFRVGDRVTGDVSIGCGRCVECLRGFYNLCVVKQEVGLCRGKDGAFAQCLTMPARHCYKLPDNVSLDDGAFTEPAATVVKAIRKVGFQPGATVLVAGDGPIGLLAAQAAAAYGAGWVVVSGTSPRKLQLAASLGAHAVVNVGQDDLDTFIKDQTGGLGVDYAVEASGHNAALAQCLQATRPGGTISVVGIYERPIEKLDMGMAVVRDLTICCSVASPNAFEQTLRLMATGKLQTKPLVTHVLDLADAAQAFELQQTQPEQRIKIHLRPPEKE
ncbi:MAG: alcohol dehydrogenase catalytic domain-containing protein [Verrucomicrobia bacterium]|nr:alcohol dehydrogenase catalytic domain-containing protein [Verrucomicrobiota bacterium]